MANIYASAILNISTDASGDACQGIFASSSREGQPLVRLPTHSGISGIAAEICVGIYPNKLPNPEEHSLLQKWAWVLQETTLSKRRLRYSERQLFWSCSTVYHGCCENKLHLTKQLDGFSDTTKSIYNIQQRSLMLA
jgi:hypothetical protein